MRLAHSRKGLSGIVAGLILFVMLFTVGSGYFLWVNTNNMIYAQAQVERNNMDQNQAAENVVLTVANPSGTTLTFKANNTGGVPVILVSLFVIDSTGNVVFQNLNLGNIAISVGGATSTMTISGYSYTSGSTITVKVLTQRGSAFSKIFPSPPVCPPTPPFCTFANSAGSATSAPIGLLILDFNSYKYYNTVSGCDPGNPGCQLTPWPGGRVAFTMAAQTSFVAFSVNLRNVDPCGRGITLDSDNLFIQFTPPKGTGPGGGTSDAWNWGIGSVSTGGVSQAFPVSGIPIPYNTSAKLFFTVSAAQVNKYPTPGTFVAILIYLHGVTTASTINSAGCPAVSQAYGQNIPFVTTLYTGTSISLSPATGPVGTPVTVTGTSFTAGSTVVISYDGVTQTTTTASGTGSFSSTFTVPVSTAGAHVVAATDGINFASATFTITPSITLLPTSGRSGSSVTVSGSGFAPTSAITATFAGSPVTLGGTTTTDATGSFSGATFTVPASPGGAQTVTVRDSNTPVDAGSATFTVIVASITLNPTSGPVGATVTVTGSNFLPSSTVTIKYDATTVATTTSSGTGSFTATFTVPSGGTNPHAVTATDGTYTASATYNVIAPSITLSPTSGPVGTSVTIAGTGFAPSSTITIRFNGVTQTTTPATVTTSAIGAFSATFTVPASAAGSQTVTATDATANSASATFTVTPSITLIPTTGPTGTLVTVSGSGFAPSLTITATFAGSSVTLGGTTTTDATGSFSGATFTVPASGLGAQTVTVTDSAFNSGSATFTVVKAGSTTVVSCTSPVTVGTMSTCTITVTGNSPTGMVDTFTSTGSGTFDATSCTLVAGSCTVHYTPTSVTGSPHLISATYEGDANNAISTATGANRGSVTVNKAGSTTAIACTSPDTVGTQSTCTITVTGYGTPTGTVDTFTSTGSGTFSAVSCTLVSGSCTVKYTPTSTVGSPHLISATYEGDANNAISTATGANRGSVTVNQAGSSTTVSCSPDPLAAGATTTCTATVAGYGTPTGTVTFSVTGSSGTVTWSPVSPTCSLDLTGKCSVTYTQTATGTPLITGSYGGDTNNAVSSGSFTVHFRLGSTTTVTCTAVTTVGGNKQTTCTATVTGTGPTPTGTVTFSAPVGSFSPSTTCTLSGGSCSVTWLIPKANSGTVIITATYSGDANYATSVGTRSVTY